MLQGHVLLHSLRSSVKKQASLGKNEEIDTSNFTGTSTDIEAQVAESCKVVSATYGLFKDKAAQEVTFNTLGTWILHMNSKLGSKVILCHTAWSLTI